MTVSWLFNDCLFPCRQVKIPSLSSMGHYYIYRTLWPHVSLHLLLIQFKYLLILKHVCFIKSSCCRINDGSWEVSLLFYAAVRMWMNPLTLFPTSCRSCFKNRDYLQQSLRLAPTRQQEQTAAHQTHLHCFYLQTRPHPSRTSIKH